MQLLGTLGCLSDVLSVIVRCSTFKMRPQLLHTLYNWRNDEYCAVMELMLLFSS